MQSKYDSSIYFYEKAIRIYKKVGNNELLGICYSNIAIDFQQKSNFDGFALLPAGSENLRR